MLDGDKQTAAILESAAPELYLRNAFRVLGLPVRSTPSELAKRKKLLKLMSKIGGDAGTSEASACLPLPTPPDDEAVAKANHRLNDPLLRLVDELFWLWPLDPAAGDTALSALRSGNLKGAIEHWERCLRDEKQGAVAAHNLAVLYHVLALDEELSGDAATLDERCRNLRDRCWVQSYRYWKDTEENDAFWKHLSERACELEDPRLTRQTVDCLREQLPVILATIAVTLALQAVTGIEGSDVARHLLCLRKGGWELTVALKIAEQQVSPYCEQIQSRCESATALSASSPAEGKAEAKHCLEDTKPWMRYFDLLFQPTNHLRRDAHDRVADAVRSCAIAFGNSTGDWPACLSLLRRARSLALGPSIQEKLDKDFIVVEAIETLNKIDALCDELVTSTEVRPSHGVQLAECFLEKVQPYLSFIEEAFPVTDSKRQDANDMVASALRNSMIELGNKTENWTDCLKYLQRAQSLAYDGPLQVKLNEDVENVRSNAERAQSRQQLRSQLAGNNAYDVVVSKTSITLLKSCTCCMGVPDREQSINYAWREGERQYSLSFTFPVCLTCLRHQLEWDDKRHTLWLFPIASSSLVVLIASLCLRTWPWWLFLCIGSVVSAAVVAIASRIKIIPLGKEHACRATAVEIANAATNKGDSRRITFRFQNPIYATEFAQANASYAETTHFIKPPRGGRLVGNENSRSAFVRAVVASAILNVVICAFTLKSADLPTTNLDKVTDAYSSNSRSPPAEKGKPASNKTIVFTPQLDLPDRSTEAAPGVVKSLPNPQRELMYDSGLSRRIDAGKAQADALEIELGGMASRLESFQRQLTASEGTIRDYERRIKLNLDVNEYSYKQAIADHNRLVTQHNTLISEKKSKYAEYSRQIDEVNEMVGRYNRGER